MRRLKKINLTVEVTLLEMDLADNSSVRKAATKIKAATYEIDGLINNANVMAVKKYTTPKNGIETQFASNHVGHFLLTNLFIDEIVASGKGATIVNVTSLGH